MPTCVHHSCNCVHYPRNCVHRLPFQLTKVWLHVVQSFFQRSAPLAHFRVGHGDGGIPVVDIEAEGEEPILDAVLLRNPSVYVVSAVVDVRNVAGLS